MFKVQTGIIPARNTLISTLNGKGMGLVSVMPDNFLCSC